MVSTSTIGAGFGRQFRDHRMLLTGSAWLVAARLAIAASGFLFWLVAAARHDASEVGTAAGLFSLVLFLNYLTALGLPIAVARYCPDRSDDSRALFFWAMVVTIASSALGAVLGTLLLPDSLLEDLQGIGLASGAVLIFLLVAGLSLSLLADVRLMALNMGRPVLVIGALTGFARIPLALLDPLDDAAIWIWVLAAGSMGVGAVLKLMALRLASGPLARVRSLPASTGLAARFAGVNALSQLAIQAPFTVVPVIVVAAVTSEENAVFFLAWSIAGLVFTIPRTVSQVLLIEGDRSDAHLNDQTRLALLMGLVVSAAALVLSVPAGLAVRAFYGADYAEVLPLLPGLVLAAIPWAIIATYLSSSRVRHDTRETIVVTGAFALGVLVPAVVLIPGLGLGGVVPSWLLGNLIGAVVAVSFGTGPLREVLSLRHRPEVRWFTATVALGTGLALVGYLLGGLVGMMLGGAAAIAIRFSAGAVLAPTALGLLLLSAVATVVEGGSLDPVSPAFALQRPLAAAAGRYAAITAIAAVVAAFLRERPGSSRREPGESDDHLAEPDEAVARSAAAQDDVTARLDTQSRVSALWRARSRLAAVVLTSAVTLSVWAFGDALSPDAAMAGEVQRLLNTGALDAGGSPLAVSLILFIPGPPWLVGVLAVSALVPLTSHLAGFGPKALYLALGAMAVGLLPASGTDVALAMVGALGVLLLTRRPSLGSALAAGVLAAATVLARPEALVVVPLLLVPLVARRPRWLQVATVAPLLLVLIPWVRSLVLQSSFPVELEGPELLTGLAWLAWVAATAALTRPATLAEPTPPRYPIATWRWLGLVCGLSVVAAVATIFNTTGDYIADFRFDLFWNPFDSLIQTRYLWDASRDLGRAGTEVHPVPALVVGVFRSYGADPWLAERLWHTSLIVTAGTGAAYLLGRFRPGLGIEHVLAAAVYAGNPYATILLVPSRIFIVYAVAPWLVAGVINVVRVHHPGRWAALSALLGLVAVTADMAASIYLLPVLAVTVLYLRFGESRRLDRHVLWWGLGCGALFVLVGSAQWLRLRYGAAAISGRILSTESVETVASTSSWSESWRGLGFWLNYLTEGGDLTRSHQAVFTRSAPVVLITFVPAVVALLLLWRSRWRPRLLMIMFALVSLVLMVGTFPPGNPSPYGRLVSSLYESGPLATGLRSTYKAGIGLSLGLSLGLAVGLVAGVRALSRQGWRVPAFVLTAFVLAGLTVPTWTGDLYSPRAEMSELPTYWEDAVSWLNDSSATSNNRVLVLPGSATTRYRWGNAGDDILEALVHAPVVRNTPFARSAPLGDDLVRAIDEIAVDPDYAPGTLSAVARRVGIRYVVIRNDLDWQTLGRSRPANLEELRQDDELDLVATFGEPGENTTSPEDTSTAGRRERSLSPVEIYEVRDAQDIVRLGPDESPVVVSGAGAAWRELHANGLLRDGQPVQYSASVPSDVVASELERGAPLVVTDTNVRVSGRATVGGITYSAPLTAESGGTRVYDLFGVGGSQTVAWYPDATDLFDLRGGTPPAEYAASNAVDGDPSTRWRTGRFQNPIGAGFQVDLREPQVVDRIVVDGSDQLPEDRDVMAIRIELSDGTMLDAPVDGLTTIGLPDVETSSISVSIIAVSGDRGRAGLAEVQIGDLDLRQFLELPSDAVPPEGGDRRLRAVVADVPVDYLVGRGALQAEGPETLQRRRFHTVGDRTLSLNGVATYRATAAEDRLPELYSSTLRVEGSSRRLPDEGHAFRVADGSLDTGWQVDPVPGERVTLDGPQRSVQTVSVLAAIADRTIPTSVIVEIGDQRLPLELRPSDGCGDPAEGPCVAAGTVSVPPIETDHIAIELDAVQVDQVTAPPVEILEVISPFPTIDLGAPLGERCTDIGFRLGGEPALMSLDGTLEEFLAGSRLAFTDCSPIELEEGWQLLTVEGGASIVTMNIGTTPVDAPSEVTEVSPTRDPVAPAVEVRSSTPTRSDLRIDAAGEDQRLYGGTSFAPGWRAVAGGRAAGPTSPLDAQNTWVLEPADDVDAAAATLFGPQRQYSMALALSAVGVLVCCWLAVADRDSRRRSR